ncbi:MAG: hypothetical protein J0665_17595 [Deltaproteobacteria bacterium]|nr:hypothetical protein [Deltaproteobacteria bacterium]
MEIDEYENRLEKLYQRSWNAMRVFQRFTISDLLRTTGLGYNERDCNHLLEWIKALEKHEYISSVNWFDTMSAEFKQYNMLVNSGPNRPVWCNHCHSYLFPLGLPVIEQIKRDSFWFIGSKCSDIYIGAKDPETSENYQINDRYFNVTNYQLWEFIPSGWYSIGYSFACYENIRRAINRYKAIQKEIKSINQLSIELENMQVEI